MIGTAFAQSAPSAPGGPIGMFLPFALIFVVFYFLLIRPQQQKDKEHRQLIDNLKANDDVVTNGGLYGKVVALAENVVTLEIAPNVRVRVDRANIATLATPPAKKEKDKQK